MHPMSPGALLLTLALLAGTAGAAEPSRDYECSAAPRLELVAESDEVTPGVCVNPDEPTTFVFGAPLPLGAVVLSDDRSVDFAQGGAFVTVYPKRSFSLGKRVKLTVHFGDGSAPENASFWLVGHATQGVRRVEVLRNARSVDALQRDAAEAWAEASRCQEEKARLLTERAELGNLMGAAWLERTGEIHSEDILDGLEQHSDNALIVEAAKSYSHQGSVAVQLRLLNSSSEPWMAASALLKNSKDMEVRFSLWQEATILPATRNSVVVGAERHPGQVDCPCTLEIKDAKGNRVVTLRNVNFEDEN